MKIEQYEKLVPVATLELAGCKLRFHTPTAFTLWRAKTLLTKEISTIKWLDSINEDERLLDIGANVGGYSLYAAVMRGAKVTAIEPEAQNFSLLCKNILLNNASELVTCWPIGVSDEVGLHKLFISDLRPGGSCHSLNEKVDFQLQEKNFKFEQGCYSSTIDQLVENRTIECPNHIKIDVDGLEHRVLNGARNTLSDRSCRSLSIELNTNLEEHRAAIEFIGSLGFKYDPAQVEASLRKDGIFKGVAEFVFSR